MILLLMSLAIAENPAYSFLDEGEAAPFEGILFNDAAVKELAVEDKLKSEMCDVEILIRDERIIDLEKQIKPQRPFWWMFGGFVIGTTSAIATFYSVKE